MPSLPTRLKAAWMAFKDPRLVDDAMGIADEHYQLGLLLGRLPRGRVLGGGVILGNPHDWTGPGYRVLVS